jgi:aminodeoxyfutalosine deaminase
VLSPAFVNAHSHLEYRAFLGSFEEHREYWPWIRALTLAKLEQDMGSVRADCELAASENRATGVFAIAEHSDRPFARKAMTLAGLVGSVFQELITFSEDRWAVVTSQAADQSAFVSPHAPYTVDPTSLARFADGPPFSIHAAETPAENEWVSEGTGPIAEFRKRAGYTDSIGYRSVLSYLDSIGLLRPGIQLVHCCAVDEEDIVLMAQRGVMVAHCPVSNQRLACPAAPVREMIDAGVPVGLGLDSAASGGAIDFFHHMRAALSVSGHRLHPEEVWKMATRTELPGFSSASPWIAMHTPGCDCTRDLIERGAPSCVEWLN